MINLKTPDWSIENIETVLFDKDGTFIDLHFFWGKMTELRVQKIIEIFNVDENLFKSLCLALGYDINKKKMVPDGITALYSRSKIIELFQKDLEKVGVKTTCQQLEEIFDQVCLDFYKNIQEYTKPINSAIKFIQTLNSYGVKIGIVTSDSVESTIHTLNHFEWNNLFDCIIGRESSPYTKESGEPTKLALKNLQANPKTTIMIGDAPMDYISAKNAKIEKTILVATGQINKKTLATFSPFAIDSLDQIKISK